MLVHLQTNLPGNTASCCFLCLETTLQGSVLRVVLSVVSAPPCRSVHAASEKEEGDVDAQCYVAALRCWGICVSKRAQSLCSVWCETMQFMKSVSCEVRVLEPPLTLGKTVYVWAAHLCDKFSRAADSASGALSVTLTTLPIPSEMNRVLLPQSIPETGLL